VSGRLLNHVQIVHRPGELPLVEALFDVLGLSTVTSPFVIGDIDPATANGVDNMLAGSQADPAQLAFDDALAAALRQGTLAETYLRYQDLLAHSPQYGMHIGIRFDAFADWQDTVDHLAAVDSLVPSLAGRVRVCDVIRPGHPASLSPLLHQAFVWTDVIACGPLPLGMQLELQHFDFAHAAQTPAPS
jgi:hypothetical protein